MGHHCPTCKKAASSRCVSKGHLEKCSTHGEYYMPGKKCASCKAAEERAAREEQKKKEEERKKQES